MCRSHLFGLVNLEGPAFLAEWFKPDQASLKIKAHPEVLQKIAAQNATLLEAGRLVDRIQIKHSGADFFLRRPAQHYARQQQSLDVVRNAGGAVHSRSLPLLVTAHP